MLLVRPQVLFDGDMDRDELLEVRCTRMIYHGSLKGAGNSHNIHNAHKDSPRTDARVGDVMGGGVIHILLD